MLQSGSLQEASFEQQEVLGPARTTAHIFSLLGESGASFSLSFQTTDGGGLLLLLPLVIISNLGNMNSSLGPWWGSCVIPPASKS